MREPPRHLTPCRVALGLQQTCDVLEHDHEHRLPILRQRHAGAGEHTRLRAAVASELDLSTPLGGAAGEAFRQQRRELPRPIIPRHDLAERSTGLRGEVCAEDQARRFVGQLQHQRLVHGEHTRGQTRQDHRQPLALPLGSHPARHILLARQP